MPRTWSRPCEKRRGNANECVLDVGRGSGSGVDGAGARVGSLHRGPVVRHPRTDFLHWLRAAPAGLETRPDRLPPERDPAGRLRQPGGREPATGTHRSAGRVSLPSALATGGSLFGGANRQHRDGGVAAVDSLLILLPTGCVCGRARADSLRASGFSRGPSRHPAG